MNFLIDKFWNGRAIDDHDEFVKIRLDCVEGDRDHLYVHIDAPFFADPIPPSTEHGRFDELWNYEVAELFLLNNDDQYLELEFDPYGHYLALMMHGPRNKIRDDLLLMSVSAAVDHPARKWTCTAKIPIVVLPPRICKLNAYAIHKSEPGRHYEALFAASDGKHDQPDFHRLQYFREVDFSGLLENLATESIGEAWSSA